MDPVACLQECEEALADTDPALGLDRLFDYYRWRIGGGFEPPQGDVRAGRLENQILVAIENLRSIADTSLYGGCFGGGYGGGGSDLT